MGKYIGTTGLGYLWDKIKAVFYQKPSTGIPKTDLNSAVQTSLGKADTALQSFTETDPTVPAWAKANTKPTYTASEVGALPDTTVIPAAQVNSDWNATSGVAKILHKPTIPAAQIQSDWNQTTTTAKDYIKNKPTIPTTYAASASAAGPADKAISIPFAEVDSTSTGSAFTANVSGITELRDGVCVYLRNGVEDSVEGCTLNINSLGAKPIYSSATGNQITTSFTIAYTYLFVYNSTRVSGGCWDLYAGYQNANASNTSAYIVRTNSLRMPTTDKFYRYRILFTSLDGTHYIPATTSTSTNATSARTVNQRVIDPYGRIVYYNSTTAVNAEAMPGATTLRDQSTVTLGYSFNRAGAALTLTQWKPVYLKCAPQTTGGAIIDADTPYVQDLPVAEDGKIYIFLGVAYSATAVEMLVNHPIYWYKDGAIRQWTNAAVQSSGGGGGASLNLATLTDGFTAQIPLGANLYYWNGSDYFPCYLQVKNPSYITTSCQLVIDTSSDEELHSYLNINPFNAGGDDDLAYKERKFMLRLESPALGQSHNTGCISIGMANIDAPSNWPSDVSSIAGIIEYALDKLEEAEYAYMMD